MVASPEYRPWHRSTRSDLRLGREKARADPLPVPADLLFRRSARDVRLTQRPDTRPERRLSVQRPHGSTPAAHAGDAAASARRRPGLDAEAIADAPRSSTGCALLHASADSVRDFQYRDRGVASAAVLQRGDGETQSAHPRAPDVHGGRGADVVAASQSAP